MNEINENDDSHLNKKNNQKTVLKKTAKTSKNQKHLTIKYYDCHLSKKKRSTDIITTIFKNSKSWLNVDDVFFFGQINQI